MLSLLCNVEHSTNEHKGLWSVPDQANQYRLDTYLIKFQPLWDRSQIKLNKLFNVQNGQIIALIVINGKI